MKMCRKRLQEWTPGAVDITDVTANLEATSAASDSSSRRIAVRRTIANRLIA